MEDAFSNRLATFANVSGHVAVAVELDACFQRAVDDWRDPESILTPQLFIRAHALYRGACEHAFAGQTTEVPPLVRGLIEYSGAAFRMASSHELQVLWLKRDEDRVSRRRMRKEFDCPALEASVKLVDPALSTTFRLIWDRTITFGAHANPAAVINSMRVLPLGEGLRFENSQLHGEGPALAYALASAILGGFCSLKVFRHVFAERFKERGIEDRLQKLEESLKEMEASFFEVGA